MNCSWPTVSAAAVVWTILTAAAPTVLAQPAASDPLALVKEARKVNLEGRQDDAIALYREALMRAPDLYVKAILDTGTNDDQRPQYPYLVGYVDLFLQDYPGAIAETRPTFNANMSA